jgi:lipopolysaccharide export system permease protein
MMVKPMFQQPKIPAHRLNDTALRARIPDDFMSAFDQQTKAQRLNNLQRAVADTRTNKDQFAGLIFERENINRQMWRYDVEWHRKFSIAFACIVLFFIGAPLGAIIRKGGIGTPVIIAVLFFVIYYVIGMIGEKSVKSGSLNPVTGMWLSTMIVMPISIFLTYMATRDSVIFNSEMYINFFAKGLSFVFRTRHTARPETAMDISGDELQPESMIAALDELSQHCRLYIVEKLDKKLTSGKIWFNERDEELKKVGVLYDHAKAIFRKTDIGMIQESINEYPVVSLSDYKIKIQNRKIRFLIYLSFAWTYFYLKTLIQKYTLRKELNRIITANQNLITELTSII